MTSLPVRCRRGPGPARPYGFLGGREIQIALVSTREYDWANPVVGKAVEANVNKLLVALVLTALPSMSSAAGVDISWDDCYGGTPTTSKVFDCAVANATYDMHFQFRLPAPLPSFVSMTAFLDYQNSTGALLSPFWRFEGGGCQLAPATDGVVVSDDNSHAAVPLGCRSTVNGGDKEDPWGGDGSSASNRSMPMASTFVVQATATSSCKAIARASPWTPRECPLLGVAAQLPDREPRRMPWLLGRWNLPALALPAGARHQR